MTLPDPQTILQTKLPGDNDAGADTIGQYLATLTRKVWIEEEAFDGKRPFGNSSWRGEIAYALILDGHLQGDLDEDGYVNDYNQSQFDQIMAAVFNLFHNADYSTLAPKPEPRNWFLVKLDHDDDQGVFVRNHYFKTFTEKEAKDKADSLNEELGFFYWTAVYIPA